MNDLPFSCQDYVEANNIDDVYKLFDKSALNDWLVQLKYDGIWALILLEKGTCSIYSKTGQLKNQFKVQPHLFDSGRIILIGEYMFGSQWSQHASRKGAVYVFDCLEVDGASLSHLPYKDRARRALPIVADLGEPFRAVASYSIDKLGPLWLRLEKDMSHEGVIIRKWSSTWQTSLVKLKLSVEDDYIIMGFEPGEGKHDGRLGSLKVGQFDNGELVWVMDVGGGFTDDMREWFWNNQNLAVMKVIKVSGKARFASGALRHPNFEGFHGDKLPEACLLKRTTFGLANE